MPFRDLKLYLLPCLLLLALTLPHLEQGDFRRDTGRYAAVGHYMWSAGTVGTPYLNPETPYFNKPPLALLIHGFFLKVFGVSLTVARVPSIIAALGVVILSMAAVRQIGSRAEAVASGFVLASTVEFFRRCREISLDLWQLLFVMAALVLILRAFRTENRWFLCAAGVPVGLALLCKPLVALIVIPIGVVWALWSRKVRLGLWLVFGTLPIALLVAFPWYWHMYSVFGDAFLKHHFGHEVVDRARGLHLKQPFYHYGVSQLRTYWPWLPILIYALVHRFRQRTQSREPQRDLVVFALCWLVPTFVMLSLFPDKKPNYALPLYPMMAWIVAAGLCRLEWTKLRPWYEVRFRWLAPSLAGAMVVVSVLPIRFQKGPEPSWVTLLNWMSKNAVVDRVFEAGLDANEICYFYLKTGQWPRRWQPDNSNLEKQPLLLTRTNTAAELLTSGNLRAEISAGNYVVLATSTTAR